jgi:SAM-dependent methyltransferase
MLALARANWAHPRVTYHREALETVAFATARFELVVSSLVLHYVEDYQSLVARIARWLTPGGIFVYSTEHPLYTARLPGGGWVADPGGRLTLWSLDRYSDEGAREETWFIPGVRKVHRTLATLLNGLLDSGLSIERVVEPIPSEEWLRDHPSAREERHRPIFLLIRARKP